MKTGLTKTLAAGLLLGVMAAPLATATQAGAAETATATGTLVGAKGTEIGTVNVTNAPGGVLLRVSVHDLTPGWHGMHFHEKASCEAPKFASAGAHIHTAKPVVHGLLHENANDNGDLPNLYVGPDGQGTVELYSTLVSLKPGSARAALLENGGSALVIHAHPDDYTTQPIGGSGDRVACAVLKAGS